jgi:serine/threonine protein kinase
LWVHCDLKSENILIEIDYNKKEITSVKVIDFGSSFYFNNINDELALTTPEYLPPEALEFIEYK